MAKRTELEDELARQMDEAGILYEREYKAVKGRQFRWDFLVFGNVLVEVQGGLFIRSGHTTGTGIMRDMEKNNLAVLAGYRCLLVSSKHIRSGEALDWIKESIR